jgi:glycosyltransferase involved in cell wall biosynthesis
MTEKVAFVTDRYWPCCGGVEQASFSLANGIRSQFPVRIIDQNVKDGSLYNSYASCNTDHKSFDPNGNHIYHLRADSFAKKILIPLLLWQMPYVRNINARGFFDYLYIFYKYAFYSQMNSYLHNIRLIQNFSSGYPGRLATEICSEKNIPLIHSPFVHFDKWGDSKCQMNAYCKADFVICPTYSYKEKFISRSQRNCNCIVIPPLTSDPVYLPVSERPVMERYFLFLGRREFHKGLSFLIEAFSGNEHSISLVIAGPGKPIETSNSAIIDLGEVDDNKKRLLLANCDFLCVPSTDETFGIVYTEAMSYKKPVIALNVAPVNEIVKNGETGILVEPGDIGSLRNAVSTLENNETIRLEMGAAAYKRYEENYSGKKILTEIMKLYKQMLRID